VIRTGCSGTTSRTDVHTPAGATYDPARDFVDVTPTNFGVVDSSVQPIHSGKHVLRGNFWQVGSVTPQPDPKAQAAGITILGSKATRFSVDLTKLGISQTPSADPNAPTPPQGEFHVSFWLWYDADFSHQARMPATGDIITQSIKWFYAFGTTNTEWVITDASRLVQNIVNLGAWPLLPWISPPELKGNWRHIEWYFKSETAPVFYELGAFSKGTFMASACNPRPADWGMAFPVPGSNPVTCMTDTQAYAANSKDGIFITKIDGQPYYPAQTTMAWNGRFARINFPAYHGGGGEPIASAGWAIDDDCIRRARPPGF
jgi:hypothetical protein